MKKRPIVLGSNHNLFKTTIKNISPKVTTLDLSWKSLYIHTIGELKEILQAAVAAFWMTCEVMAAVDFWMTAINRI